MMILTLDPNKNKILS